jgi:integrase
LTDVAGDKPIGSLAAQDIDKVVAGRRLADNGQSSINTYCGLLKGFGKWAVSVGYTKTDVTGHLRSVKSKVNPSKRRPVPNHNAGKIVTAALAEHPRDGMTALLALSTGLRDSELTNLRWKDCDWTNKHFTAFRPKIQDWLRVYWTPELEAALVKWRVYVEREQGSLDLSWFIVPRLRLNKYVPRNQRLLDPGKRQTDLRVRVKSWLAEADPGSDLAGRASHTLRRTSANLVMATAGGNVRAAQRHLGHAPQAMTEKYLDVDAAELVLKDALANLRLAS